MKWINCPTCKGRLVVAATIDPGKPRTRISEGELPTVGAAPCPTCTDSDGNPTGRVGVMSDDEIEHAQYLGHTPCTKCVEFFDALDAELSHRKENR
jgi:hypothetical protein